MPPATKPSASVDDSWEPPASFDQFVIERALGSGGMGHVYVARDVSLDRLVALKFISAAEPSPAARGRFLVEARAIAKLTHRNVVGVYRIGEIEDRPYIAYEFVDGQSLDRMVKPMSWETTLRIAVGLAAGLEAAHREGILHRDIKPSNAVLSDRGEIKLLDFGLAKLAGTDDAPIDSGEAPAREGSAERNRLATAVSPLAQTAQDRGLTRPGTIMGTPAYLAPELWFGDPASPRSDVWALGLVLYELLVGSVPHGHLDGAQMTFAIVDTDMPSARTARPDAPESFVAIIDRCLRRDGLERFPSAVELSKALDEVSSVFLPASGAVGAVQVEPERVAVAASLARMSSRMRPLTARLYERLFEAAPAVRALFPEDLSAQQDKLAHALRLAIDGLADPERLAPILEDLGRRHVRYGVMPEHFEHLEKALLGALAEIDRAAWDETLERGWKRAYAFIEAAMRRGMATENKTAVSNPALSRLPPRVEVAEIPKTRYATSGELSIAYQVVGERGVATGPIDIVVLLGWLSHVEIAWQHPALAGFLRRLGQFARVIIFDKRGTGMSDRAFESSTIEDRVDDLEAVLDAAESKAAVLLGVDEGAATATMFAAMHPTRVRGLVLYGARPSGPDAADEDIAAIRTQWGEAVFLERDAPSMQSDSAFRSWRALFMRMAASPGTAIAMLKLDAQLDLRGVLPLLRVPALVLHRTGDRAAPCVGGRQVADGIPGARFVELAGDDHIPYVGDTGPLVAEIKRFAMTPHPQREDAAPLVAVLSILGGTDAELPHDFKVACAESARSFQGEPAASGAPALAFTFDGGVRALRCARDLLDRATREGIYVRLGLDAGPAGAPCVHSASALARITPTGTARVGELISALALGSGIAIERADSYQASSVAGAAMPSFFISR